MEAKISTDDMDALIVTVAMKVTVRAQDDSFEHMGYLQHHAKAEDVCLSVTEIAHFRDPDVVLLCIEGAMGRVAKAMKEGGDWRKELALALGAMRRGEDITLRDAP